MTDKIAIAAQAVARPDTEIIAANSQDGPASIQGFLDVATCMPGLLAEVSRHPDVDAIVIACFDDTGVDAVRHFGQGSCFGHRRGRLSRGQHDREQV